MLILVDVSTPRVVCRSSSSRNEMHAVRWESANVLVFGPYHWKCTSRRDSRNRQPYMLGSMSCLLWTKARRASEGAHGQSAWHQRLLFHNLELYDADDEGGSASYRSAKYSRSNLPFWRACKAFIVSPRQRSDESSAYMHLSRGWRKF